MIESIISQYFTPFSLTLIILLLSAIFFMHGKVRSDIVALCALLMLMLLGILTPAEALAGFSSSVIIMMIGLFVVGAGIFRTGLAKMVGARILKLAGDNENLLFLLVMLVTALIGTFISNTGTVAMMIPIVMSMTAGTGKNVRRFLMPLAFASAMGMFTLISTPPNLVIQEALVKGGFKPLTFFSFAPVGAIAVTVGVVVLFFLSRLLRKGGESGKQDEKRGKSLSELVEEYKISTQIHKIVVLGDSPLVDKKVRESKIATSYLVSIVKIVHKQPFVPRLLRSTSQEVAGPESIIRKDDVLYCHGSVENIDRFVSENHLLAEPLTNEEAVFHFADCGIAELFITPDSSLINHTVHESKFRKSFNINVLGIKHRGDYKISEIRDVKLHAGDALLIQGTWEEIAAFADRQDDFVLIGQPAKEAAKVTLDRKAPLAAVIMLAMVAIMVLNVVPAVTAVLVAAILMVITGCLHNMEEAYGSINWHSVVLIGAMIPMATAFEKTGVTPFIAHHLLHTVGDISPYMLLAIIYGCTSLLTLFLSNTATAILFAPIALQAAINMNINPYPLLFGVAVAASMCFASPFSTPPNALVMSAGKYSFKDYVKVGLPLQVVMGIVMVIMLPIIFPF